MKFIHAHQMAKNTIAYPTTPSPTWSSATSWWSADAAWATATTKHRSKNSSSAVALRCSSSVARASIGRYHAPAGDPGGRAPSTWSAFMGPMIRPGPLRG